MSTQRCAIPAALLAAAILVHSSASTADAGLQNDGFRADTIVAVWRVHHVDLVYHSATVYYSCGALQSKISAILRAVGAHTRVFVDAGCMSGDFVNHTFARVTLATPVEATPAAIRAAATFDARERLIARLRKIRLPTEADVQRFPAEWQTVSLSRQRGLRLDAGDCDLLRALRKQVFPQLAIRVDKGGHCTSGLATRLRPRLEVTALMPASSSPGAASDRQAVIRTRATGG